VTLLAGFNPAHYNGCVPTLPRQTADACDVVLVSCYELGHEPLGVLTPAGVLDRAGYRARVLDVAMDDFDPALIARAPLVAISTPMHTALRLGARVAERVREINPAAHVCFFGLYAGLHEEHLVPVLADTCLGAEFEADLLELVAAVSRRGDAGARAVRLAAPAREAAGTRERTLDLAPRRSAQEHGARYVRLQLGGCQRATGYVTTTRGCKHTCRHCPIPAAYGGTFYALPAAQVLADIDAAVALGAQHITFGDADFLNGPTHALRIAREMRRRHPALTFDYTAKIEHLLRLFDVVDELQGLGNLFVVSALESFSDEVLRRLHKGHTAADALAVIHHFERGGLTLRPSLVPFTPWETRASLASLFEIVAREGLVDRIDPVQYSIRLLIPSGSLLLQDADIAAMIGGFDAARFTHRWSHPDPEMDRIHAELAVISGEFAARKDPVERAFLRMAEIAAPGRVTGLFSRPRGASPRLTEDWFC
jgi:radical SAM superfamily enzyme YgiQ (UPF0313 family)